MARVGILFTLLYLSFGVLQRNRAKAFLHELAASRAHQVERLVAKPTLFNILVFRGIYEVEDTYHLEAVRISIFGKVRHYGSSTIAKLKLTRDLPDLQIGSRQYQDLKRFEHFSDGFLAIHPKKPDVIGDVRYALLPQSNSPLWGIVINQQQQDEHVAFENFREVSDTDKDIFKAMIFNHNLPRFK